MPDLTGGRLRLHASLRHWRLREPFAISRRVYDAVSTLHVRLTAANGATGRGEGHGVDYAGETPETMLAEIEAARDAIEAGISRVGLLDVLPAGGARFAVDAALWDLEAKQSGIDPFARAGVGREPVHSVVTIGIRALDAYEDAARAAAEAAWIKVKVGADAPLAALDAVRRGAPGARLLVDPNQAWSVDQLKALAPRLVELGVGLLEQPIAVGAERELDGYTCPVPLCADEALGDIDDLPRIVGRFAAVNIKLDKVGGLTAALRLADAAEALGLELMVGTMVGPSLGVAPAMVLAQRCRYADLDGPPLLVDDDPHGFLFAAGLVRHPHEPALWG